MKSILNPTTLFIAAVSIALFSATSLTSCDGGGESVYDSPTDSTISEQSNDYMLNFNILIPDAALDDGCFTEYRLRSIEQSQFNIQLYSITWPSDGGNLGGVVVTIETPGDYVFDIGKDENNSLAETDYSINVTQAQIDAGGTFTVDLDLPGWICQ